MNEQTNPTIEDVTIELRRALFSMNFWKALEEINGKPDNSQEMTRRSCAFVEFGVRTKLLSIDEGNDWLDFLLRDKGNIVDVMNKWQPSELPSVIHRLTIEEDAS